MEFVVVIEQGETSFGAHVPDLPGCFAMGLPREDVPQGIRETIALHLEGMRQDGLPPLVPVSTVAVVEVAA